MIKKEELENIIQTPLIRLVYAFKEALRNENFILCGEIKAELDRRKKLNQINKSALKDILEYIDEISQSDKPVDRENFINIFEKYF